MNIALAALLVLLIGTLLTRGNGEGDAEVPAARAPGPDTTRPPLVTEVRQRSPTGRFERATCQERRHSVDDPTRWFHPSENFYPPGREAPTRADLDHLVNNDGAVVVIYPRHASPAARKALQRWAATGIGVVVAPAGSRRAPPLEAYTSDRRLTCDGVDLDQLTTFTDRHFSKAIPSTRHGARSG